MIWSSQEMYRMVRMNSHRLPNGKDERHFFAPALKVGLQVGPLIQHNVSGVGLGPGAIHIQVKPDVGQIVGVHFDVFPGADKADFFDTPSW